MSGCRWFVILSVSLPTSDRTNLPPPHTGLTRVEDITALGDTFTKTISFEPHILKVANKAATCLYALKTLKAHGLQGQALRDVTLATLVAQLHYASPAWSGFIKSGEKAKLQSVLNKTARYGFLPEWSPKTIDELLESSDITVQSSSKKSRPRHTPTPSTS